MRNNLPEAFVEKMERQLSAEADDFFRSLTEAAPVSVRVNPFKKSGVFAANVQVPWSNTGRYLPERPIFTLDPLFHAGAYYVQEASSMFLEQVFKSVVSTDRPLKVLDLCAAPGGKSTLMLSVLDNMGLLVANEVIPKRNAILCENITKWGSSNVVVTQNDAADFAALPEYFDVIVADAPCSGEGLFRKDADAVSHWSEQSVLNCAARQQNILKNVLPALKTGGALIYSTCTYEQAENEDVIKQLLDGGNYSLCIDRVAVPQGVVKTEYGFQFYSHKVAGEGFFISCVVKETEMHDDEVRMKTGGKKQLEFADAKKVPDALKSIVDKSNEYAWFQFRNEWCFVQTIWQRSLEQLGRVLSIKQAGTSAGILKGNEVVFNHAAALANAITLTDSIELTKDEALKYLKGETLHKEAAKGWQRVSYKGLAIGWVKAIPGRLNNHYPKEWRIRMNLPPQEF